MWGDDAGPWADFLVQNSCGEDREIYLLQRRKGKLGAGLGKTTGWIHRVSLKKGGVNAISGVRYLKIDDEGLHLKCVVCGPGPECVVAPIVTDPDPYLRPPPNKQAR